MDIKTKLLKLYEEWATKLKDNNLFSTLKFKFLFWNIILSTVSIFIILFAFFETAQYVLYSQFNSNLLYTAHEVSSLVGNSSSQYNSDNIYQFHNKKFIGYFILVLNSNGHVIAESNDIKLSGSFIKDLFGAVQKKSTSSVFNQNIGGRELSLVSLPVFNSFNDLTGVVIVGNSVDIINQTLHTLFFVMFFMSLIFIFIVVLFTFYFSDKITEPLSEITSQIVSITGFNLNQRLQKGNYEVEFNVLSDEFNKLFDRLEATFQREKNFINDVAHEIKTPLAIIRGENELALNKKNEDIKFYRKILEANISQSSKIEKVLNDVLSLARIEYRSISYKSERINLYEVLSEMSEDIKIMAEGKKLNFEFLHKGKDFYIFANKENISKAIFNIVSNSLKYTKSGFIKMNLYKKNKNIFIEIEDSGIGIEEKDKQRIFNRFYRASNVKNIDGSGLGLSLSKSIIEGYLGSIFVESEIGKGSKFTINFNEIK